MKTPTPPASGPGLGPDSGGSDSRSDAGADAGRTAGAEPADDPELQGEGNYTAARRHRESVQDFIDAGRVEPAARDAAPQGAAEEQELKDAEAEGRAHARR